MDGPAPRIVAQEKQNLRRCTGGFRLTIITAGAWFAAGYGPRLRTHPWEI